MPAPKKITPSYLRHSQSGRARAVWTDRLGNRQDRFLPGPFESPESRTAFARLLLELDAAPHHTAAAAPAVMTMAVAPRLSRSRPAALPHSRRSTDERDL